MIAICIVALLVCVGLIDAVWLVWLGEWAMLGLLAVAVFTPVMKWLYRLVALILRGMLHYPVAGISREPESQLRILAVFLSHVLAALIIGGGLFALCAWQIEQSRSLSLLTAAVLTVNIASLPSRKGEHDTLTDTLHTVAFVAAVSTSVVYILGMLLLHADVIACGLTALPVVILGAVINLKLYRKRALATGGISPWNKQ